MAPPRRQRRIVAGGELIDLHRSQIWMRSGFDDRNNKASILRVA